MIRNYFYSFFLHLIIFFIALCFFWQQKKEQNKKPELITGVVFMQTKNNQIKTFIKEQSPQPQTAPQIAPKPEVKLNKNLPKSEAKQPPEKKIEKKLEKKPEKELVTIQKQEVVKPSKEITPPPAMPVKKLENTSQDVIIPPENVGVVNLQVTQQDIDKQLNSTLSKRETFNIQAQFRACYKRALAVMVDNGKKPITPIIIKINLNSEGYIITNLDNVIDKTQYHQNENYKNSIDSIKKMIEFCNPIVNLAKEKYSVWQEIVLQLNENNNL